MLLGYCKLYSFLLCYLYNICHIKLILLVGVALTLQGYHLVECSITWILGRVTGVSSTVFHCQLKFYNFYLYVCWSMTTLCCNWFGVFGWYYVLKYSMCIVLLCMCVLIECGAICVLLCKGTVILTHVQEEFN